MAEMSQVFSRATAAAFSRGRQPSEGRRETHIQAAQWRHRMCKPFVSPLRGGHDSLRAANAEALTPTGQFPPWFAFP
jgi:hypothetical protein